MIQLKHTHKTIWFLVPSSVYTLHFHRKVLCWLRKLNRKAFRIEYTLKLLLIFLIISKTACAQDGKIYIQPVRNVNLTDADFKIAENILFNAITSDRSFTYYLLEPGDSLHKPQSGEADLYLELAIIDNQYTAFAKIIHRLNKNILTAFQVKTAVGNQNQFSLLADKTTLKIRSFKQTISSSNRTFYGKNDTILIRKNPSPQHRSDYASALKNSYFSPAVASKDYYTSLFGSYPFTAGLSLKWYYYRNLFLTANLAWAETEKSKFSKFDADIKWSVFPLSAGLGYQIKKFRTYPLLYLEAFSEIWQLKTDQILIGSSINAKSLRINSGINLDCIFKRNIFCSIAAGYSHLTVYSVKGDSAEIRTAAKSSRAPLPLIRIQLGYNFD